MGVVGVVHADLLILLVLDVFARGCSVTNIQVWILLFYLCDVCDIFKLFVCYACC